MWREIYRRKSETDFLFLTEEDFLEKKSNIKDICLFVLLLKRGKLEFI
ncbi:hypothetical protein QY97_03308 [Bacillus thermotolerans]|nr:hypothetical protein QY97_03308 [Bacillus thermotolerans]